MRAKDTAKECAANYCLSCQLRVNQHKLWVLIFVHIIFVKLTDDHFTFPLTKLRTYVHYVSTALFQACEPAAQMALEDVNNYPHLLPGYQLKLHWNDSAVSELAKCPERKSSTLFAQKDEMH